jgi:hypothetical protein
MAFTQEVVFQMLRDINVYAPISGCRRSEKPANEIINAITTRCSICANFMFHMYGYSDKEEVLGKYKQGNLEEGYLYEILNNVHYVNIFVSDGLYFVIESVWNGYPPEIRICKKSDDAIYASVKNPEDSFHVKRYKMGVAKINIIDALKNKRDMILNDPDVLEEVKDYFRKGEDKDLKRRIQVGRYIDADEDGLYIISGRS